MFLVPTSARHTSSTIGACSVRTSHAAPDGDVTPEEWRLRARCRGMDIAVFYLDDDNPKAQPQRERTAKNICRRCPVITECRQYAIHFGEQHGVWGGLTPRELGAARKWSRWQRKPG
ncbi:MULTISPECIES: WhiB family transcriptional regulator [Rhodococcus]|uniref:WhiB family transcriptional regulator n=1 Tax=Rhodococcus TaxID=1827 RepID=UPI000A0711B1|nr:MULTISPECIES: WhiB family transcriptional regulator [Rhodococcus]